MYKENQTRPSSPQPPTPDTMRSTVNRIENIAFSLVGLSREINGQLFGANPIGGGCEKDKPNTINETLNEIEMALIEAQATLNRTLGAMS